MQWIIWIIGVIILMGCVQPGGEVEPVPATPPGQSNDTATPPTTTLLPTTRPNLPAATPTSMDISIDQTPPATASDTTPTTEATVTTTTDGEIAQPIIDRFVVAAGTQAGAGDRVSVSWRVRRGGQVALCYGYFQEGETNEDPLSVAGEHCTGNLPQGADGHELTLAPPVGDGGAYYVTFLLQVLNGVPGAEGRLQAPIKEAMATRAIPAACAYQWFHSLDTEWCPRAAAVYPGALAQSFEHGLAIYVPRRGPAPNRLIVLYDDGRTTGAMGFPVTAAPAELETPPGLQAPAPEFYSLWARGSDNSFLQPLRDSLGWSTSDPIPFTYEEQCAESPAGTPDLCYITGPQGSLYVSDVRNHNWKRP